MVLVVYYGGALMVVAVALFLSLLASSAVGVVLCCGRCMPRPTCVSVRFWNSIPYNLTGSAAPLGRTQFAMSNAEHGDK